MLMMQRNSVRYQLTNTAAYKRIQFLIVTIVFHYL
jgi:hypothetical protein